MTISRDDVVNWDRQDPLASFRQQFALPDGQIYLDGNSLGARPKGVVDHMHRILEQEWGDGLIASWVGANWVDAPRRIGDKIAELIGAQPGEMVAADSTSVNIFKALTAALSLRPDRHILLTEAGNFPTDQYMMQGLSRFSAGRIRSEAVPTEDLLDRMASDVAVLLLTHVHYKTGYMHDMARITRRAHEVGALVIWDLSHSTGALEIDLNAAGADFAVGCGYKFLNGGPGAPAYLFAANRHHDADAVLSGWFGHADPFDFDPTYRPAPGIDRFQCGTPPVLGLAALEHGVDILLQADMAAIRQKSVALSDLFIDRMQTRCADFGFHLASPTDSARRGSHVSYGHDQGYPIMQAMKARGITGDFRAPDIMRFGLTPLYTRYCDVYDAVEQLRDICITSAWQNPDYHVRAAVT